MFNVSVNGSEPQKTEVSVTGNHFHAILGEKELQGDFIKAGFDQYHFVCGDKSYNVIVEIMDRAAKKVVLRVNSERYEIDLRDKYDDLLHRLGMDAAGSKKINEIKAPMPGLVLNILVKEGDEVKKGDPLIVLEAMKMENILKSPGDGTIKRVAAVKGSPVEKNQLLIQF